MSHEKSVVVLQKAADDLDNGALLCHQAEQYDQANQLREEAEQLRASAQFLSSAEQPAEATSAE